MATLVSSIITSVRNLLNEPTANYWTDAELIDHLNKGVKDLWRDTVDLKAEHFLKVNTTDVTLPANSSTLSGVPADVHKIYIIEALDSSETSTNVGLRFEPLDWNHERFIFARTRSATDPANDVIYYAIHGQGAPIAAPTIRVAPQVTSTVSLSFAYVPSLQTLGAGDQVPIPGEADNALVAWVLAFARAKESDTRSPDAAWMAVYGTEKQHLLQALGLRQYQDPLYTDALFDEYWG